MISLRASVRTWATVPEDCQVRDFAVLGRFPAQSRALARPIAEPRKHLVLGNRVDVGNFAIVYADVEIGNDTLIGDGASVREGARIGARCVIGRQVTISHDVRIGDDVRIMDGSRISGETVIGDGCFFGMGVVVSNDRRIDLEDYGFKGLQAPVIGKRVMVGSGANLVAGITVGDRAVIGSGALVVRDVPEGARMFSPIARQEPGV